MVSLTTPTSDMTQDEITDIEIVAMSAAFAEIIQSIRDTVVISELARLIELQAYDDIYEMLGLDNGTFYPLNNAVMNSYNKGGSWSASELSPIPTPRVDSVAFRFDMTSTEAVRWVSSHSSNLVTEVIDDQKEMIREVLARRLEEGVNPRQSSLDLIGRINVDSKKRTGGMIGLTSQQAEWVDTAKFELQSLDSNYLTRKLRDRRFDPVVKKAIENGKPLTKNQIQAIINSLQNRTLKYRADNIARTESVNALRAGQYESISQAIGKGGVTEDDVTKEWDSSGDDGHTRHSHLLMEGQIKSFSKPFETPTGFSLMYAGDDSMGAPPSEIINCRCRIAYRIDFIGITKRLSGFR